VVAVGAAAASAVRADAQPVEDLPGIVGSAPRVISPGVEVFEVSRADPQLVGRVARIAPDVVRTRLRVVVSNDAIAESTGARREATASMCRRYRCVVGVNADQWYVTGADASTPIGGTVVDGELFRTPEPNPNPFISMGQLQFDVDGNADARQAPAGWTTTLSSTAEGAEPMPLAVNRIPLDGEIALYTHRLGRRTPDDPGVSEWIVEIGAVVEGVTSMRLLGGPTPGGSDLRPGQGAIAARGASAVDAAGALLYDGTATVTVDMDGAYHAVGGFPVLFEDGEYTIFPDDAGNHRRDARTVAGWTADGTLLLVTADQRADWSHGLSITEAARLLRTLGAVEAMNLDGGGSTTFVEGGFVTNQPSDGTEAPQARSTVDALVIVPPEGIDFAVAAPRSAARACPAGQVPAPPFDDLDTAATHLSPIACAAWRRIAGGTGPRTFSPLGEVSRAQMAAFLERMLLAAGVAVPGDVPDRFDDDSTSIHQVAINRMAAMGVVLGVGDGRYAPTAPVTRNQMATFLTRAVFVATGGGIPVAAEHDYFDDDPLDPHQQFINLAAELGIAGGVSGTSFNPGGRVSRAQMATFLVRTLDAATP
jgi:exopolysaccharide biosynthesis protein